MRCRSISSTIVHGVALAISLAMFPTAGMAQRHDCDKWSETYGKATGRVMPDDKDKGFTRVFEAAATDWSMNSQANHDDDPAYWSLNNAVSNSWAPPNAPDEQPIYNIFQEGLTWRVYISAWACRGPFDMYPPPPYVWGVPDPSAPPSPTVAMAKDAAQGPSRLIMPVAVRQARAAEGQARLATYNKDLAAARAFLQQAVNCLSGEKGVGSVAGRNVCSGLGNGAIADAPSPEEKNAYEQALQAAQAGLNAAKLDDVQKAGATAADLIRRGYPRTK